jgi:hypothetical protein
MSVPNDPVRVVINTSCRPVSQIGQTAILCLQNVRSEIVTLGPILTFL